MITLVELPTEQALIPLVAEQLGEQTEQEFIAAHVNGINEVLTQNPKHYRNYGAYWWSIKALLKEHGFNYGEDNEQITADHFNYENKAALMLAAWYYQNHHIDMGHLNASIHVYDDGDEPFEYSIEDTDMEARIINKRAKR